MAPRQLCCLAQQAMRLLGGFVPAFRPSPLLSWYRLTREIKRELQVLPYHCPSPFSIPQVLPAPQYWKLWVSGGLGRLGRERTQGMWLLSSGPSYLSSSLLLRNKTINDDN